MERNFPNARTFACLAFACALLLMYGCFVPFEFRSLSLDEAGERFSKVLAQPIEPKLNTDYIINLAMFAPLGFTLCGCLASDRRFLPRLVLCLLAVPLLTAFSTGIEFTQLFIPKRVSSVQDVFANTVGGAAGCIAWFLFGAAFTKTIRGIDRLQGTHNVWQKLIPIYLIGMVVLHCAPFDLVDFGTLKVKYKWGGFRFIPFHFPEHAGEGMRLRWQSELLEKSFFNIGYFFPAGLILAGIGWPSGRGNRAAFKVLAIGFAFAAFIECLQFPVFSRAFDATDIVTGGLAVAFGWSSVGSITERDGTIRLRHLLLAGWIVGLFAMNWWPFDFAEDAQSLRSNGKGFNWTPFLDYYEHDYLSAFDTMFRKMLVFAPVGALLARREPSIPWLRVIVPSALLAVVIEAGQNFLPGHFPTISDVLIEPVGAVAGMLLARLAQANATGGISTDSSRPAEAAVLRFHP